MGTARTVAPTKVPAMEADESVESRVLVNAIAAAAEAVSTVTAMVTEEEDCRPRRCSHRCPSFASVWSRRRAAELAVTLTVTFEGSTLASVAKLWAMFCFLSSSKSVTVPAAMMFVVVWCTIVTLEPGTIGGSGGGEGKGSGGERKGSGEGGSGKGGCIGSSGENGSPEVNSPDEGSPDE